MLKSDEKTTETVNTGRKTTTSSKPKSTRNRTKVKTQSETEGGSKKESVTKATKKTTTNNRNKKSTIETKGKRGTSRTKSKETQSSPKKTTGRKKTTSNTSNTTKKTTRKTPVKKNITRKTSTVAKRSIPDKKTLEKNEKEREELNEKNADIFNDDIKENIVVDNSENNISTKELEVKDDTKNVMFFDENNLDKSGEFVDLVNVAFLHPSSTIIEYKEGNSLIVEDTLKNRYKLKLVSSPNPVVDPKVSVYYVMRPAKFKKGDVFDSELVALFSNEEVANAFLTIVVNIHNKLIETIHDDKIKKEDTINLIDIHRKYLKENDRIWSVFEWFIRNKIITICLLLILFNIVISIILLSHLFSPHKNMIPASNIGQTHVSLSPTEEKIRADNMVISEINRIQNNQPPAGPIGQNIRSRGLNAEKIAELKKNIQEEVAKLIEIQGKINSGMGAQKGGNSIPFSSQTDRFGISNVPPEDSWSTTTGARMSVPSGSNGVASQKDLAEFGIINQ